jgi:signal transduction histidine kinase
VLLVDDEEAIALTLGAILAEEGYAVDAFTNVPAALAAIEQRRYAVALIDLRIGNDSGLTVLAHLRRTAPEAAAIVLTGFGSLETAIQALREGASDYLLKPCDVDELKAAVARGVARSEQARRIRETVEAQATLDLALRAADEFLTLAGHELKTPLAVVVGWAQYAQRLLAQGATDEAGAKLDLVVRQAQRVARLVDTFTQTIRIRHGTRLPAWERIDLSQLVEEMVGIARDATAERRFQLALPDVPVAVHASRTGLAQVLENLLDNAVKFSPTGSVITVSVSIAGGEARLEVRDEGAGIAAEQLPAIFEPFRERGEQSTSAPSATAGLGLYVSRALTRAYGGRLEVTSAGQGQGSTAILSLPLA